ncbi:Subtilisin DY [Pirellula sp. SH-Sr6A]|uniref:S8 family peptidase n=1 Tax=Pirellula sp. SH-Sr6A TaxID=1632865 RepID=UPI00078ED6C7|nr:S8 family serine peptidase [Pirellula sp. SH-Sr6A]AMV32860.1 Subtilisin DY [Pirellula sp. SH-Sr6A]
MFLFQRLLSKRTIPRPAQPGDSAASPVGFRAFKLEIDRCEQRLALSAMPWMPGDWSSDPLPDPEYHATAPKTLPGPALAANAPDVEPFLARAHEQTGWTQVASQYGLQGNGQTVAIIDSGIAYDHYALGRGFGGGARVVGGWDFAENDSNPYDDAPGGFHGTHVAGIVGANYGVHQGVAPGVDLVALRVFNDFGKGEMAWTESALRWVHENRNAFENPITTVNLSLGASWNSSTIPAWASLEEELAQLQRDGIVVVVSAGNSFQQYKSPGLAYPAASPYVLPVASLDANQQISDFSQRDSRVIAAPGRGIESSVPDYFYGKDGVANDWAKASGTSMAAPYVAGASVLLREAMDLVGIDSITPQSIYDTLRNTASNVFDSVTNQIYKALDLDAAIESILPRDEVGNQWESASAQSVQNRWTTDGWINTLSDVDVYRLQSSQSGTLQFQFDTEHLSDPSITLLRNGQETSLPIDAGTASFSVVAGESIGIRISDGASIGRYSFHWDFSPANATPSLPWFASVQGDALTIRGNESANAIALDLSNGIQATVDGVSYRWSNDQVRTVVVDGMQNNDSIRIVGSSLADKVELHPGSATLTNERLHLAIHQIETIEYAGGGGPDRAYLYDAATDDRLVVNPNRAELTGVGYKFSVEQVDRIFVHALQGGDDQAFVYDSVGNDTLSARPQFTSMSGTGYFNYLSGFERIFAYSNQGGVDRALLYDSVGNDLFSTSGEVTSIVGNGFSTFARGFESVEGFSMAGGVDRAIVYAPAGGRLTSGADFVGMEGNNRASVARSFDQIETFVAGTPVTAPQFSSPFVAQEVAEWPSESGVFSESHMVVGGNWAANGLSSAHPMAGGMGDPIAADWKLGSQAEQDSEEGCAWFPDTFVRRPATSEAMLDAVEALIQAGPDREQKTLDLLFSELEKGFSYSTQS